jgi:hypothetical protein
MKKLLVVLALSSLFCIPALAQDVPRFEIFGGAGTVIGDATLYGAAAAVEFSLNEKIGIVADFGYIHGGGYGNATFMAGPRFTLFRDDSFRVFAHGLAGGLYRGYFEETEFIIAPGGGVDFDISERFAVRPAQVDFILWMTPEFGVDFRYSAGIIFKFGSVN